MHEAFWNGLFDVRWEDAPLGPDAIRLVLRLCARGYSERTCRDYGHAVVHLGRVLSEELGGVDGIRDARVVEDFLGRHLPACCCCRRPPGRREEQVRRGLAHLLAMLREEGTLGPVVTSESVIAVISRNLPTVSARSVMSSMNRSLRTISWTRSTASRAR